MFKKYKIHKGFVLKQNMSNFRSYCYLRNAVNKRRPTEKRKVIKTMFTMEIAYANGDL